MAKVGIGLPTRNGGEFLVESLRCLQEQTFGDFEVAISDNGSTDDTSDICADFVRKDNRFRHFRLDETIPWMANFSRARDLTDGSYFMWRADDDLAAPNHLECLVGRLDGEPNADIAVAPIRRIVEEPFYHEKLFSLPELRDGSRIDRLSDLLLNCHPSWFYGLWRREAIVRDWDRVVEDYGTLWACDHLALLPSILDGKVALSPEAEFIQRIKRQNQAYRLPPAQLMQVRKLYRNLAIGLLNKRNLSEAERQLAEKIVEEHIERRVARKWKTYKRMAKAKIKEVLRLNSQGR